MLRIFADSGSSIKTSELSDYGIELLPLKLTINGNDYEDGKKETRDIFYEALINEKQFPKTSLPSLGDTMDKVNEYTENGDLVLILTISSAISGTYNALHTLFCENERVLVYDTKSAVGGVRILLTEALKHKASPLKVIEEKLNELRPRIKVAAIPESIEYLYRGGRLGKKEWMVGSLLQIKPLITLDSTDGTVKVLSKDMGKHRAMLRLLKYLHSFEIDSEYGIIASYTYSRENLDTLLELTEENYRDMITVYDDLTPAIACHWGPNAFGYVFVAKGSLLSAP